MVLVFAWLGAFFSYAAVWQASVQIGISTWWIGPRSQPAPVPLRLLPFAVCVVVELLIVYDVRRLSAIVTAAGALTALVAVPDLSRSVGLAVVEGVISLALVVVGLTSFTGRYRVAGPDDVQVAGRVVADPPDAPA